MTKERKAQRVAGSCTNAFTENECQVEFSLFAAKICEAMLLCF